MSESLRNFPAYIMKHVVITYSVQSEHAKKRCLTKKGGELLTPVDTIL